MNSCSVCSDAGCVNCPGGSAGAARYAAAHPPRPRSAKAAAPAYAGTAGPIVKANIGGDVCSCFLTDDGSYVCVGCEGEGRTAPSPTAYDHRTRKGHCSCQGGACSCTKAVGVDGGLDYAAIGRALDPLMERLDGYSAQLRRLSVAVTIRQLRAGNEAAEVHWRGVFASTRANTKSSHPETARGARLLRDQLTRIVARGRRVLVEQLRLKVGPGTAAAGAFDLSEGSREARYENEREHALAEGKKPKRRRDEHENRPGDLETHLAEKEEQDRNDAIQDAVAQLNPETVFVCLVQSLFRFMLLARAAAAAQ